VLSEDPSDVQSSTAYGNGHLEPAASGSFSNLQVRCWGAACAADCTALQRIRMPGDSNESIGSAALHNVVVAATAQMVDIAATRRHTSSDTDCLHLNVRKNITELAGNGGTGQARQGSPREGGGFWTQESVSGIQWDVIVLHQPASTPMVV
jgi:hypothetical protein